MKSKDLKYHILRSYISLRIGIAAIAFFFPILLIIGGLFYADIEIQDSLSAYYHAIGFHQRSMRNWFVGILFAIGVFLFLYRGYSNFENYILNLAGIFALCIALIPMQWGCTDNCDKFSWHGLFAIAFFLSIAIVCVFCASDTLHLISNPVVRKRFRRFYHLIGIMMVASPVIAYALTVIFNQYKQYTLYIEIVGIYTFACYWIVKSREIVITESELHALDGTLEI